MSFKFTALTLDHGPTDALQKLLLMSLTDRCDEKGVCFPSRDDIIKRTGASYATISRKLRLLEAQGWIQRRRRFNSSTVFRINIQRLLRLDAEATSKRITTVPKGFEPFEDEVSQPIENKGTVHSDPTSVHSDTHISSQRTPNLSKNQSFNLPDVKTLTAFEKSCLLSDRSVLIGKKMLRPSDKGFSQLVNALRNAAEV